MNFATEHPVDSPLNGISRRTGRIPTESSRRLRPSHENYIGKLPLASTGTLVVSCKTATIFWMPPFGVRVKMHILCIRTPISHGKDPRGSDFRQARISWFNLPPFRIKIRCFGGNRSIGTVSAAHGRSCRTSVRPAYAQVCAELHAVPRIPPHSAPAAIDFDLSEKKC